ncbi:MAG TPA: hypothetical protein PKA00_10390 [Saprospiraceae bacterium]|nr:hypothetical protein [Saprospiraceae bacterium]HMQ83308.1 hypothetical protein [Saprospiraceae bacterium]
MSRKTSFHSLLLNSNFQYEDSHLGNKILFSTGIPPLVELWENILCNDRILLFERNKNLYEITALQVIHKSIHRDNRYPLSIQVQKLGQSRNVSLKFDLPFSALYGTIEMDQATFEAYWNACGRVDEAYEIVPRDASLYNHENFSVRVASSWEDMEFVKWIAQFHDFGYSACFLNLILEEGNERKAAMGVKFSSQVEDKDIELRNRLFGEDLPLIDKNSLIISRIYAEGKKFKLHEHLLNALLKIASSLVSHPQYSLIEGISYDFHPIVAIKLDFNYCAPKYKTGVFYYWKFLFFNRLPRKEEKRARDILAQRREENFWIIYGKKEFLELSFSKQAWGLEYDDKNNNGIWHVLKKGDVVFLCAKEDKKIYGYQIVDHKSSSPLISGFDFYKLWIKFNDPIQANEPFSVTKDLHISGKGILPIERKTGKSWKNRLSQHKVKSTSKTMSSKTYWLVLGTDENLQMGFSKKLWALTDAPVNTERWGQLMPGDVLLFCKNKKEIVGYGEVRDTRRSQESMFKRFPLVIDLGYLNTQSKTTLLASEINALTKGGGMQNFTEYGDAIMDRLKGKKAKPEPPTTLTPSQVSTPPTPQLSKDNALIINEVKSLIGKGELSQALRHKSLIELLRQNHTGLFDDLMMMGSRYERVQSMYLNKQLSALEKMEEEDTLILKFFDILKKVD